MPWSAFACCASRPVPYLSLFLIATHTRCQMPYSRITRMSNHMFAVWKWLLSFRKREWALSDYPIRITAQESDPTLSAPRFIQHLYRAYIVNWTVTGSGDTPEHAMTNLEQNFENIRQNREQEGKSAIRPGGNGPIEFASQEKVSANEALSEDFIQRVLGLEWAWISDESSLWDFHTEQTNDLLYAKIREVYGIDVSDIESARLWAIFERIENARASGQNPS